MCKKIKTWFASPITKIGVGLLVASIIGVIYCTFTAIPLFSQSYWNKELIKSFIYDLSIGCLSASILVLLVDGFYEHRSSLKKEIRRIRKLRDIHVIKKLVAIEINIIERSVQQCIFLNNFNHLKFNEDDFRVIAPIETILARIICASVEEDEIKIAINIVMNSLMNSSALIKSLEQCSRSLNHFQSVHIFDEDFEEHEIEKYQLLNREIYIFLDVYNEQKKEINNNDTAMLNYFGNLVKITRENT